MNVLPETLGVIDALITWKAMGEFKEKFAEIMTRAQHLAKEMTIMSNTIQAHLQQYPLGDAHYTDCHDMGYHSHIDSLDFIVWRIPLPNSETTLSEDAFRAYQSAFRDNQYCCDLNPQLNFDLEFDDYIVPDDRKPQTQTQQSQTQQTQAHHNHGKWHRIPKPTIHSCVIYQRHMNPHK
jgi:hypothetical protein